MDIRQILIDKINSSYWWHVVPRNKDAYKKHGKFLASTYGQAEFYGRPQNNPERVNIANPLWSDSETHILKVLFPDSYREKYRVVADTDSNYYQNRIALDALMHERAMELGYDCMVLLGSTGMNELRRNRKPRSIELNLCV